MFCFKCGQRIADSSLFCDFCGADQRTAPVTSSEQSVRHPAEPLGPAKKTVLCCKCGKQIDNNARFCDFCGADQFPPAKKGTQQVVAQPVKQSTESSGQQIVAQPVRQPAQPLDTEIKTAHCANCGKKIDASRFCSFCGADQFPPPGRPANQPVKQPISKPFARPEGQPPVVQPAEMPPVTAPAASAFEQPVASPFAQPAMQQPFAQPAMSRSFAPAGKKAVNKNMKMLLPVLATVVVAIGIIGAVIGISAKSENTPVSGTVASSLPSQGTTAETDPVTTTESPLIETTESATDSAPAVSYNAANTPVLSTKPVDITRTVFIYIVGSNLESVDGSATRDIQEMLDSDFASANTQVLLCAGGAKKWQNDLMSASETAYFHLADHTITKRAKSDSPLNMGIADTLADFLSWGVENYPADRYSLFLWNHGGGPLCGFGTDEISNDYLSLAELVDALQASPFHAGKKLETLGFDACLMGTVETAWAFRDYADYYIASQEVEPGNGWDYTFLKDLPYCEDGDDIGKVIIDSYYDFYMQLYASYPRYESEITLSCIDLSALTAVETEINKLFATVNQDVLAGKMATASRCRNNSKVFGKSGSTSDYDLIDLTHITSLLKTTYTQAFSLEQALGAAIVYSRSNAFNANGLSIYHPYENIEQPATIGNFYRSFNFAANYTEYIINFMDGMKNGSKSSYRSFSNTLVTVTENEQQSDLSIQLTEDQMQTFSSAKYYVFWEIPADQTFSKQTEYLQVFSGQDVNVSADGKLTATYNGKAVFGKDHKTGEYSDCPLSMYQIYDGSPEEKFYFPCMFSKWYDLDLDIEGVRWLMEIEDGVPVLRNAYRTESLNDNFPDKKLIDPENYDYYAFANNSYFMKTDEDGNSVLEFTQSSYGFEYVREDGFSIELRPIEDKSQYRAVFQIEDIYGNSYFSAFIPLE